MLMDRLFAPEADRADPDDLKHLTAWHVGVKLGPRVERGKFGDLEIPNEDERSKRTLSNTARQSLRPRAIDLKFDHSTHTTGQNFKFDQYFFENHT